MEFRKWFCRLLKSRAYVYKEQLEEEKACNQWLENFAALLPSSTFVKVKLDPLDKAEYASKFSFKYSETCLVVEQLSNGKTYRLENIVFNSERQVTREQMKVINIFAMHNKKGMRWLRVLPRFRRVNLGETVLAFQKGGTREEAW